MSIVSFEHVKKEFADRVLFDDVSFSLEPKDHVGFIGVNGSGKSTLLKMLLSEENCESGTIRVSSQITVAYVEQSPALDEHVALYDFVLEARRDLIDMEAELNLLPERINSATGFERERLIAKQSRLTETFQREDGLVYRNRTRAFLLALGFSEAELKKPVTQFSGGQIGKAALCRAILKKADLLLLDEPTNNLDIPAIAYLQSFLSGYSGAFLLVSHDREFLDGVADKILELENGHIIETKGNYSRHMELKSDARERSRRQYAKTMKEIKRIEGIITQQKSWNQERNYVTIASKEKQIERLRKTLVVPERDPQAVRFRFLGTEPTGNEIFSAKGLSKSYPSGEVFHGVDFLIQKGETVCIIGANGCGKSTLLKIIDKLIPPDSGVCIHGAGVRIGYFEQSTDTLDTDKTVAEEIHYSFPRMDMSEVRGYLGCFLFRGDDIHKKIGVLSGGERARIKLLKLVLNGANVLLLDEPTNHFDIQSCEVMEKALEDFGGTVVIVTHDRYLVKRMADRVFWLKKDGIEELDIDSEDMFSGITAPGAVKTEKQIRPVENYYKKQKERKNEQIKAKQLTDRTEAEIARNEKALEEVKMKLAQIQSSGQYNEIQELCTRLELLEKENAQLYERLEEAENDYLRLLEEK